jgi:3-oxoacyl-[acyl-carrier protein] reductase
MERGDLQGRVAIVTGSSSGIGAATAIALARRGASVVVNYAKSEAEANATADAVRDAGADARVMQGDVARDEDCRRLAGVALEAWGRIDILINNAGTTKFAPHADLDALSAEDWLGIYSVNVVGPFQMIRACREPLKAHWDGAIVNVSSIAAVAGVGSSIAYAASKGALNTMTLSLSRALAPEIRVNAVCPGYVATPWFTKRFGEDASNRIAETTAEGNPLKRVASPEDIANAVVFFAGPESHQITGETLLIDSGMHLNVMAGARR